MSGSHKRQYFTPHEQMDYEIQMILGGCYYGAADAGEILATADRIREGDFESWYQEWYATAAGVQQQADEAAAAGHVVSARRAYLRAANYYATSIAMIDGTQDPSRGLPTWKQHLACWGAFCARLVPPAEKVLIPYENTPMPGYLFRPQDTGGPWATVIFNNGSDAPVSAMWALGVAGALERGYAALIFDGPGQNALLWLHGVPFRHDWEKVITPVMDYLLARGDVDPRRIALSGISQGGYWILRALAFEHRIAAGIADPGVMDVFTVMAKELPEQMRQLLDADEEEPFNREMAEGLRLGGASVQQRVAWRMKPYGTHSYYQFFKQARLFNVRDAIRQVRCPMFIADPDDEQFWPGQSREVYDALVCPKVIVRFTAEEGANWHCEPKARSLYDQRMFDWLATVMPAG
jgi:Prolyl oligopeptidase family